MGLWDGIEDAEVYGRGVYLPVGWRGVLQVQKTLAMETQNVGLAFIVEMVVVESNMAEYPAGMQVSWFQKMADKRVAFPAIIEWAAACKGYSDKDEIQRDITPNIKPVMDHATQYPENNGFTGDLVRAEVVPKTTRKGLSIGIYRFTPHESALNARG